MEGFFRFDDQKTVPALSLQQKQSLDPSATWTAENPVSMGLHGLRSSLWIARYGKDDKSALANRNREFVAEQDAIWSYTNNLKLTSKEIPDSIIRRRALHLVAEAARAPSKINLGAYAVGINAIRTDVSPSVVTVTVQLSTSQNLTLSHRQAITMYADGRNATIYTDDQTYVNTNKPGSVLPTQVSGSAPDKNTAIIQLPRNDATMEVDFSWQINFLPGLILLPNRFGATPIVTTQSVPLVFQTNIILDPSQYPTLTGLLNNKALSFIARLRGWEGWIAVALLIWVLPLVSRGLTSLVVGAGTKSWQLFQRHGAQTAHTAKTPEPDESADGPGPVEHPVE